MNCFDELTYAMYLDNELGPEKNRQIKSHINQCRSCNQILIQLETENQTLRSAMSFDMSVNVEPVIMNRIESDVQTKSGKRPSRRYRPTLSYAASIAAMALLVIWFVWSGSGSSGGNGSAAETQVILCSAKLDEKEVQSHVIQADESETYIWLEKE